MHRRECRTKSRRWCLAAMGAILLAVGASPCLAADSAMRAVACPDRPIHVAFYEFGALFVDSAESSGGFIGTGIDVDLMRELKRRSGCAFEAETMKRARIWSELEQGRLDMTTSGVATPERERLYAFAPYIRLKHEVWMLADKAGGVHNLAEFTANPALRWGVVRGYRHTPAYDAVLDQARAQGRVVEATDDAALVRMLAEGTVDAFVGHAVVVRRYAEEHPRQPRLVALDWAPQGSVAIEGLVLSRARFSEADIASWRKLVRDIVHDGTMLRIIRRHVSAADDADMVPAD